MLTAKDCANLRLRIERFGSTIIDNVFLLELIGLAESTFDQDDKPITKANHLQQEIDDLEDVVSDLERSIRELKRMHR